jgi:Histidine kinase
MKISVTSRYFGRIVVAWALTVFALILFWATIFRNTQPTLIFIAAPPVLAIYLLAAFEHRKRVAMVARPLTLTALANVQERQVEVPLPSEQALMLVHTCLTEMPQMENVSTVGSDLHVQARFRSNDSAWFDAGTYGVRRLLRRLFVDRSELIAVVHPHEHSCSVTFRCEPEGGLLANWLRFDRGSNYITAENIVRNLSRKLSAIRSGEQEATIATATQKELAEARLGLLHAQIEPHFLYNTLGSAKYLIRINPSGAEGILDNLILYLRNSLPRLEDAASSLGDEVARARAYLDIMQIRMGGRLMFHIQVPETLLQLSFPTMMLQTLVENAIKHGLEPKQDGGAVWLMAKEEVVDHRPMLAVTVADNGLGMNGLNTGTGIGHRNIRERLKLLYSEQGELLLAANFPSGVAATIRIPTRATDAATKPAKSL